MNLYLRVDLCYGEKLASSGALYGLVVGVELTLTMSCGAGRLGCARGVGCLCRNKYVTSCQRPPDDGQVRPKQLPSFNLNKT
jgi:hypothetical protein